MKEATASSGATTSLLTLPVIPLCHTITLVGCTLLAFAWKSLPRPAR